MADGTLTVTYNTRNGNVKLSGIAVTDVIRRLLCQFGISVRDGDNQGKLVSRNYFGTNKRGDITMRFEGVFDQDPNPYHATDNLFITFTAQ